MNTQDFLKNVTEQALFTQHQKVLVAVSGGLDSMNLLLFLYELRHTLAIQLTIAHVNHGQRLESAQEEAYLRRLAKELGLPIHVAHFTGHFTEARARRFRYHFFEQIMQKEGQTALVTGHHADDQAETILMRLLRGSRLRHLAAIPLRQPFGPGELLRPLLPFHKQDFPQLFHFEDASNQTMVYLRNRVRQRYLPQLSQENPRLSQQLLQLGQEADFLTQALDELSQGLDYQMMAVFQSYSHATQYYFLQQYLQQFPDLQLTQAQFEQVLSIIQTKANYRHPLKAGYQLVKDYHRFEISKISPQTDFTETAKVLQFGNTLNFGGFHFSFGKVPEGPSQSLAVLDVTPITLRHRQPGDRIQLHGLNKKVSRYMIDQKIPQFDREQAVIIEQNQQILAIHDWVTSDLSKSTKHDIMKTKLYIQKIKEEREKNHVSQ